MKFGILAKSKKLYFFYLDNVKLWLSIFFILSCLMEIYLAPRVTRTQTQVQGDRLLGPEVPGTALFKRKPGQTESDFAQEAFGEILDSVGIFPKNVDSGPSRVQPAGPQQGLGASLGGRSDPVGCGQSPSSRSDIRCPPGVDYLH